MYRLICILFDLGYV
ncbi:hypothetical protein F383_27580 [Gossypium arboreum]|uniref:Uncharacterized protein n=1 Tax=Gossypium arboreum TaxID=29729 RepID=A0A0B0P492_GOSAR|nr:hypothetical protein F383_27580 [Gossypium arboreum]